MLFPNQFYRATEGNGHARGYAEDYGRQHAQQELYIGENSQYRYAADQVTVSYTSGRRDSKARQILDLRSEYNKSAPADIWDDTFEPESPPPLSKHGFDVSFDEDLKNARAEFDVTISAEKEDLTQYTDSEYSSSDIAEDHVQDRTSTQRKNEISATIFQSSTKAPITIIVTTPIEEIPDPVDRPPVLKRTSASFPLAPLNSDRLNNIDTNLLMPPTDNQLDQRKLRKAQEFREIRKWLIIFINSKGDKFPRKLRLRMMDLYSIREFDLAPEIVAKFRAEMQYEGVTLDAQGGELDDAASLSILGAAFRSQIEEVTPRKEKVIALPVPPSWARQGSLPKKLGTKKPEPGKVAKESRPSTPAKEELDVNMVPSWMAPLISTSTSSRDSLLSDQQYLKRAYSAPNLKPSRPHLQSTDSTHSVAGLRPRGSTVDGEQVKRTKRSNFISGAFGAMRDAVSGRSPKREDKVQKKKAWDSR